MALSKMRGKMKITIEANGQEWMWDDCMGDFYRFTFRDIKHRFDLTIDDMVDLIVQDLIAGQAVKEAKEQIEGEHLEN